MPTPISKQDSPSLKEAKLIHEFGQTRPACIVEDWPGKYTAFPWLEYAVTIPNPIFIVTTRKENGMPNAALESWQLILGSGDECYSLLALRSGQHTYQNILREKEWCINYPNVENYTECFETIWHNGKENDEIVDAGFTLEESKTIKAPRIAECRIHYECVLVREEPLFDNLHWHLFIGRVVHTAIDERAMVTDPKDRVEAMKLMYNVRGTINPATGEYYGPNTLGLISQVLKVTPEDGSEPLWKKK